MLELGWRSFQMLAQSIDACMRAFAAALQKPLTRKEKSLFARIYLAHRDSGKLPLVLLKDRFPVLKSAILDIWNKPGSRKAVGVLRRLIWYYAECVANRRAGDREYKRRSAQRNENHRPAIDMPLRDEDRAEPDEDVLDRFKEMAIRAARAQGYPCEFANTAWDARVVSDSRKRVVFDITCPACHFDKTLIVSRKEFTAIAKEVEEEA
jgi:hypothetical protein